MKADVTNADVPVTGHMDRRGMNDVADRRLCKVSLAMILYREGLLRSKAL